MSAPNLNPLLTSNFNKDTEGEFWHYLAKNNLNKSTYEKKNDLQTRIVEIYKRLKVCSFNSQAVHGWTPLHVAVLLKNEAAVSFFISQGARTNIQDKEGKVPADYASPEIKKLFEAPFKPQFYLPSASLEEAQKVLKSLLPPPISLPSCNFSYQENTNDFGLEIKEILVAYSPPKRICMDHVLNGLTEAAKIEGFKLSFTKEWYYPRDAFIRTTKDVTTFTLPPSSDLSSAIEKSNSKAAYFGESSMFCARVRSLVSSMGMSESEIQLEDKSHFSLFRKPERPIYLEGGDLFTLTNTQGKRKILVGKNHLAQIHIQFLSEKYFEKNPPQPLKASLSDDGVRRLAEEMYALGLLGKKSGFITPELMNKVFPEFYKNNKTFRETALDLGLAPFIFNDEEKMRSLVEQYAAQKEAVKEALTFELGALAEDVHFIPPIAIHLDMFMQPGPKGSVFMQDFSLCASILKQLINVDNFTSLRLCPDDYSQLSRYLETAEHLDKTVGPLVSEAKSELEKAGFVVIPTPGLFYDKHHLLSDKTYHINFLNAVTGWSEAQKRYYYITLGANSGTWLGKQLMQLFSMFLNQYEPNLTLHFVGEDPQSKGDFSQGMQFWNQVGDKQLEPGVMAGVHCLTFEKKAKSHKAND